MTVRAVERPGNAWRRRWDHYAQHDLQQRQQFLGIGVQESEVTHAEVAEVAVKFFDVEIVGAAIKERGETT